MNKLNEIFEAFNHLKVLVIGDVMIDSYIWGSVNRISPEAPVPIVHVKKREQRLGGAGNVALNLQSLGATPILCSVIGEDPEGEQLLQLLAQHGLSSEGIVQSQSRITTVKHRILASSQQLLRIDAETDQLIAAEETTSLLAKIISLLPQVLAVVFEDYDKGTIGPTLIERTVEEANRLAIPSVVDPKKRNFLHYKDVTLFKPNLKEIKEGLKVDFNKDDKEALEQAVAQLQAALHTKSILLTLSEKGVFIQHGEEKHHIPAYLREIADVSGAGDTVVSIAALCLALAQPAAFTAALANLGGGLVCEHLGVVPINKEDLYQEANIHQLLKKYGY
ncbi:MAG: bifunctional heptose 7-phosphate kinase/heptose 1-phosphate adenyltransferase [Thermonemataceae bacterium]